MSGYVFESAFEMADALAKSDKKEVILMAKRIILSDDISGKEDESVATYTFMTRDGKFYQIDLSSENVLKLDKALAVVTKAGREVTRLTALSASNGSKSSIDQTSDIRVWARQNGYEVGDRGRMPEEVIAKYNAAHTADATN